MSIPTAQQAAQGYRAAYHTLDPTDPKNKTILALYERIFSIENTSTTAMEFQCALVRENLHTQLAAAPYVEQGREILSRASKQHQPYLESHTLTLLKALQQCRTPTEVAIVVAHREEVFAANTAWLNLFLEYTCRVLCAVLDYESNPQAATQHSVHTSYTALLSFMGVDWDRLWSIPCVWQFFCEALFPETQRPIQEQDNLDGSYRGEVGTTIVRRFRKSAVALTIAQLEQRTNQSRKPTHPPLPSTPEKLRQHLTITFLQALGGLKAVDALTSQRGGISPVLWGKPLSLEDIPHMFDNFAPPCPGTNRDFAPHDNQGLKTSLR